MHQVSNYGHLNLLLYVNITCRDNLAFGKYAESEMTNEILTHFNVCPLKKKQQTGDWFPFFPNLDVNKPTVTGLPILGSWLE